MIREPTYQAARAVAAMIEAHFARHIAEARRRDEQELAHPPDGRAIAGEGRRANAVFALVRTLPSAEPSGPSRISSTAVLKSSTSGITVMKAPVLPGLFCCGDMGT